MDFKIFHDGLVSSSLILFVFSGSLLYTSIFLKPYLAIEPSIRDYLAFVSIFNIIFALLFLFLSTKIKKVFALEIKNIIKFGKILTAITIPYTPHFFFLFPILFIELHQLQIFLVFLILLIEAILIMIIYKEIYDLLLKNKKDRKFQIKKYQQFYYK